MKKWYITFSLLTFVNLLSAHEFWLQPEKFLYETGDPINIRFQVGENFEGENWTGDTSKVKSLKFYYGDSEDDLATAMGTQKGDSIQFTVMDEGTAMVTFNSKNSRIELDSAKFNAYLLEDGLSEAIEYRRQHTEADSMGREFYQRSVKTILQFGEARTTVFKQATDLPLDIIPQENPYSFKDSGEITLAIYFGQEVLKNKQVKVWHREKGKTMLQQKITDDNGIIHFTLYPQGEWMVSCVQMIPFREERKTKGIATRWQSYWGSCTWGYQ